MADNLNTEYDYYLANQQDLFDEHGGKVLVIKDQKVIGTYDSELVAIESTQNEHELGTFLVQRAESPDASSAQHFHSRVVFD